VSARGVFRSITEAFRSEFGKPARRRGLWPICEVCRQPVPPPLCLYCGRCETCCVTCDDCGVCARACQGHDQEEEL
jgi:hypothetical protein